MNTLLPDDEHLVVQRLGNELHLLNKFSDRKNILLRFIEGNMIAAFLDSDKTIDRFDEGEVFHYGWDDLAPWCFGGYEMLGANHGSLFAFRVHTVRHWCFTADIGKVFTDEAGNEFVLIAVENLADLIFHSRAVLKNGKIEFAKNIKGKLIAADKRTIQVQAVNRIQLPNIDRSMLTVHYRYNSVETFAGDQLLTAGECVRCKVVKMVLDIDLCPPDALCEYLIKHPGRYVAPNAPELESLLHMRLTYTFQAGNTMQADAEIEFLQDIDQSILFGLLQYYGEKFFDVQEKFVPKIKPFDLADFYNYRKTVDLGGIWKVPQNNNISKTFLPEDCCDECDVPCRYIDFFGTEDTRLLGVVLGYSRLRGMTAKDVPARKGVNLILPATGKIYPYVLSLPKADKGEKFTISAYRQFFAPAAGFNGAMFGHYENSDYCFYADCADGGVHTLQLPEKFAGKSFEIIERYGNVVLPGNNVLDAQAAVEVKFAARSGLAIKVNSK